MSRRQPSASVRRARAALAQLISGTSIPHAISVAASLGVADLLERGPQSTPALVKATGTDEDSLGRLLRALGAVGVFAHARGRFALTPLSRLLRTRAPGSMRSLAELVGAPSRRAAFSLAWSVRTGRPAFEKEFGLPFFDYLTPRGRERRLFADAMTYHWRTDGAAILECYDFSDLGTVVDVGGGSGAMIERILRTHRSARGVIVDLPAVARETRRRIASAGLARRCDVVGADFFKPLPRGDLHVLAFVLHNWDDRAAGTILRNCRRSMAPGGRLLIIESPLDHSPFAAIHDLEMLLYMRGGRERSLVEYRRLIASAGLAVRRVIRTKTTASLIEAVSVRAARSNRRDAGRRRQPRRPGAPRGPVARRSR